MIAEKNKLKEKIVHGNYTFPICVYSNKLNNSNYVLNCHWHEEVEFIYIEKGNAVLQLELQPVKIHEGQVLIVNSSDLHSGCTIDNEICKYDSIVFGINMLSNGIYDICQSKYFNPLLFKQYKCPSLIKGEKKWEKEIINLIKEIVNQYQHKNWGFELVIKANLLKVISLIVTNNKLIKKGEKDKSVEKYKIERIKKVLKYIEFNYNRKITIDELANSVNLSKYHFSRFFKSFTGRTCVEYINCYRVNKATQLLKDNKRKIMDISLEVGFNNFSYFINIFRKYKNLSPSEYRDKLNKCCK